MKMLAMIAMILLIIGGLNWGLVGFFNYNLVGTLFGDSSALTKVIYDLVGLSAIVAIFTGPGMMKK